MYVLFAVFFAGVLTKLADLAADRKPLGYLLGGVYGILIAYVLIASPVLAPLGLAIVVSVIAAGKIDRLQHAIGVGILLLLLGLFGLPQVDPALLIIFVAGGVIDEVMNGYADRGRLKGFVKTFFGYRLTLEVLAFVVSLLTGIWILFFGMLLFDAGYVLAAKAGKRLV